jgi:hypothetical protein
MSRSVWSARSLLPLWGRLRTSESASKLGALHTLRVAGCQQPDRAGCAATIARSVWSARSLLPLWGRLRPFDSASKLGALHTLRESGCQQPGRAGRAAAITRSVWSARSLLPLWGASDRRKAPASWAHSIRFASQDVSSRVEQAARQESREAFGVRGACSRFGCASDRRKAPASWAHSIRFASQDVSSRIEQAARQQSRAAFGVHGACSRFGCASDRRKAPASWSHSIRFASQNVSSRGEQAARQESRATFRVLGACSRFGAPQTVEKRQQAGRTPYASRGRRSAARASRPRGRNRAQRLECAELVPALGRLRPSESASKLVALHTLRAVRVRLPLYKKRSRPCGRLL